MNLDSLASPSPAAVINVDYSLLDYATICWTRHLEAGLNDAETHEPIMRALAESLEIFVQKHWIEPTRQLVVSQRNRDRISWFEGHEFFEKLLQSVTSARKQTTFFGNMKKGEVALDVGSMVGTIRKQLEKTVGSADSKTVQELQEKYSAYFYKCSRISCQFFTTGFQDSGDRDKHIDKHERPFRCTVEACTGYSFGCITSEHLKNHISETHSRVFQDDQFPSDHDIQQSMQSGVIPEAAPAFVREVVQVWPPQELVQVWPSREPEPVFHPIPSQQRTRRRGAQKESICSFCDRKYTKKYNWKSHLLTHMTQKLFKCTQCDKSFAGESDMRRHETTTHGEKTHVCSGCGKSFARADILSNHHKTKAGKLCIRPSLGQVSGQQER